MCEFSEGGFDAAQDDWKARECSTDEIGIDDGRPIRSCAGDASGRVCVVMPFFSEGGIMAEHGVQGAGGDAAEESGPSHALNIVGCVPMWLCDDSDFVAGFFEPSCQEWDAE